MTDLPVRDDGWADYEERGAVQRCPQCGKTFRTLADERDMHDCPSQALRDEASKALGRLDPPTSPLPQASVAPRPSYGIVVRRREMREWEQSQHDLRDEERFS